MKRRIRWLLPALVAIAAASLAATTSAGLATHTEKSADATTTPIEHLVVIFQENVSFDHYFATYPNAANPAGEPPCRPGMPLRYWPCDSPGVVSRTTTPRIARA